MHVSVPEHAAILRERLALVGTATFADLTADCVATLEVIARFMALLELYRERSVALEQPEAFADLTVTWTADRDDDPVAYAAALEDEAAAAEEAVRARDRRRRKKNRAEPDADPADLTPPRTYPTPNPTTRGPEPPVTGRTTGRAPTTRRTRPSCCA